MAETLQGITHEEIKASVARGEESKWNVGPDGEMLSEGYTMNDLGEVIWVGEGSEPGSKTTKSEEEDESKKFYHVGELPSVELQSTKDLRGQFFQDPSGKRFQLIGDEYIPEVVEKTVEETTSEATPETTPETTPTTDPLRKLFDYAADEKRNWYTNSYEDFQEKYSTEEAQAELYDFLKNKKTYTNSKGEFLDKYV